MGSIFNTGSSKVTDRSRSDLEAFLATASPHLRDLLIAALEDGPGTESWADAEFVLGKRSVPS